MKRAATYRLAAAATVLIGTSALMAAASGETRWSATSKTAMAITGDIGLSATKLTFQNGRSLSLVLERRDWPFKDDIGGGVKADVYRVDPPADPVLLNGNRACGTPSKPQPVTFVLVWRAKAEPGPSLVVATASGPAIPSDMDDICGTYGYDPAR